MLTKSLFFFCASVFVMSANAQVNKLPVTVSLEKGVTKDTLWLTVRRAATTQKPGTLFITAYQTTYNQTDSFYFPVIDTVNFYGIIIPATYQQGMLKMAAYFYPKIFEVTGMVKDNTSGTINALVITNNQKIYNKAVTLNEDKQFALPGLIFENKASLIFSYANATKKQRPNIIIEQTPSLKNFKDTVWTARIPLADNITEKVDTGVVKLLVKPSQPAAKGNDKSVLLNEVIVTAEKKSKAEKFNEQYTTGMFNDADEKVIDCLDNNYILSYPDCLSFLKSQIAGLTVNIDKFGENAIYWRGHETKSFFIDEIEVDVDQIININVNDIAIIKVFPPPFFGASGGNGDGGAIAIYTRVGEFKRESTTNNKWLFSIKGYSPAVHTLFNK